MIAEMISAWPVVFCLSTGCRRQAGERHGVRPVHLDDLVRELASRDHFWWSAGGLGVLQADVHQGEQDRVPVRGGVTPLIEQFEDLLGETDRATLFRVRHRVSQYRAFAGMIHRMPPRGSATSPRRRESRADAREQPSGRQPRQH